MIAAVAVVSAGWWRGLDSNQCTLSEQIYSLPDLTTLPPLHRAGETIGARHRARRRGGLCLTMQIHFLRGPAGALFIGEPAVSKVGDVTNSLLKRKAVDQADRHR